MLKSDLEVLALEVSWLSSFLDKYHFLAILVFRIKKFLNLLIDPIVLPWYLKIIHFEWLW